MTTVMRPVGVAPEREDDQRFRWSRLVWWACQDLNLRPHPYQAYSRDAFKQLERWSPRLSATCR